MDVLKFKVVLPAEPANTDIVKGLLEVTVDGTALDPVETTKGQTEVTDLEGPQGANVTVSFSYMDEKDNKSPIKQQSFTLNDTVAPPAPGEVGIEVTGEETTADDGGADGADGGDTPPAGGDGDGGNATPPAGGDGDGGNATPPAGGDGGGDTPPAGDAA